MKSLTKLISEVSDEKVAKFSEAITNFLRDQEMKSPRLHETMHKFRQKQHTKEVQYERVV